MTAPDDPLRWDDVRVLLAILRAGSFTLAARALGTDQSTVSRRVAALEARLGGTLFERTSRGPRPTELAERLREAAERVDDEMHRFADAAAGNEPAVRGRVRIATSEGLAIHVLVPQVLPVLAKAHPELVIELSTGERAVDLSAREADIALRFFRGGRGDLVTMKVATIPTAILARRGLARRVRRAPTEALPWIVVEVPGLETPEAAWVQKLLAGRAVDGARGIAPRLVCTSYEVQLAAVRAGLGVGIAPRAVLQTHRELVPLDDHPPGPPLELFLVTRRAIRTQPRIVAVVDVLLDTLKRLDA
jgi:DNA-binding transcriptional LysR family regulator